MHFVRHRLTVGRGTLSTGLIVLSYSKNTPIALKRTTQRVIDAFSPVKEISPLDRILSHIDIFPLRFGSGKKNTCFEDARAHVADPQNYDIYGVLDQYGDANYGSSEKTFFNLSRLDPYVLAHEIGHILGLTHPDDACHSQCASISRSIFGDEVIVVKADPSCPYIGDMMSWCHGEATPHFSDKDTAFLLGKYSFS